MMIWKLIRSNLIKWWYVVYTPIVRKIWPTKEEKELYEKEHPEEFEEESDDIASSDTNSDEINQFDSDLLNNKNYNATTNSMSGEYGKGPLDDTAKAQLDAIIKNNYNATDSISIENMIATDADQFLEHDADNELAGSNLTLEETNDALEQLRQAEEIYERLRNEAAEDEAKKQAEIEAAKIASDNLS